MNLTNILEIGLVKIEGVLSRVSIFCLVLVSGVVLFYVCFWCLDRTPGHRS